jgi:hypothetical protein
MTDFRALIRVLVDAEVRFILVGGVAAVAHGSARLTQDLDVVYDRAADNLAAMVAALAAHRPYLRDVPPGLPFRWEVETLERGLNFTLTTSLGDVDLLGEIAGGGGYADLIPHTVELTVFGHPVLCLDLHKLIAVKRAAGRPKDLEAVAELERLRDLPFDGD